MIHRLILSIFFGGVLCLMLKSQEQINPYPNSLLTLVNIELKDTAFAMIHKREKGSFLLFVINNSSVLRCLPRHKGKFILKSNCSIRDFGYHPRSYSVYCLPAKSFIVLKFSEMIKECKLFSLYEDEDFNEFLSWAGDEDVKEAMVLNNLEPPKQSKPKKKLAYKTKIIEKPIVDTSNKVKISKKVNTGFLDSENPRLVAQKALFDSLKNENIHNTVNSTANAIIDIDKEDSLELLVIKQLKAYTKSNEKEIITSFGLELPEFEFSELIESEIESDSNTVADIFRDQVESSSKKKNLRNVTKLKTNNLALNQNINLDSLDRNMLKDIIRELQSEINPRTPKELNVVSNYIIPKLYAVDSIPVNNDALLYKIDIGKVKFVNHQGQIKIKSEFKKTKDYKEGMIAVKNGKWGFLNSDGEMVIKPIYMKCESFSEGLALVKIKINEKKKWGYIDYTGNLKIFPEYDGGRSFSEGFAAVNLDDFWGYINRRGIVTVPFKYDEVRDFHDGLAAVQTGGLWGFVNYLGEYIIQPRFDDVGDFNEGLVKILVEWNIGYMNESGKVVVPPKFEFAHDFSEGLALVKDPKGKNWGYINTKGKVYIPYEFSEAQSFSEGLAAVKINDLWGYINTRGSLVIPAVYDEAGPFNENLAFVTHYGNWAYIDKLGNVIWKESDDDY